MPQPRNPCYEMSAAALAPRAPVNAGVGGRVVRPSPHSKQNLPFTWEAAGLPHVAHCVDSRCSGTPSRHRHCVLMVGFGQSAACVEHPCLC